MMRRRAMSNMRHLSLEEARRLYPPKPDQEVAKMAVAAMCLRLQAEVADTVKEPLYEEDGA